jgi:hypothetical protein
MDKMGWVALELGYTWSFGKGVGGESEALDGCLCGAFIISYWSLLPL